MTKQGVTNTETGQQAALPKNSAKASGRFRLLAALLAAVLLYGVTLPWQRRIATETARIESQTAARQAAATQHEADGSALRNAAAEVERHPTDARAQMQLAQTYADAGRLNEAEARAEIAAGLQPASPEPLLVLADIEQRQRRYDAAMRTFRAALAIAPSDSRARVGLTYLMISFGWPLEAEALLKPAVAETPGDPYLKAALALAYVQHDNYKEAERLLQEAKRIAPDNAALWCPLVSVYNDMRRYDQAIRTARFAMIRLPYNAAIVDELGKAYYASNDDGQAEAAFRQALAIQQDDLTAHYYLGLICQRTARIPDAVAELETVLRRDPDFKQTRKVLSQCYLRVKRTDDARKLLREADAAQARGQKHQRAGLLVAGRPTDPTAHWQMATLYYDEHNNGRALVEVRRTLELDPGHQAAKKMLVVLQSAGTR